MGKRSEARFVTIGRTEDPSKWHRRDPVANYLMERLGTDSPIFGEVMQELIHFRRYGVELTIDVVSRIIDLAEERYERWCRPVSLPVVQRDPADIKRRAPSGRFHHVDVSGSVVYYMRIGNRVKIGTSTNLRGRLEAINPEELLAVERGGVDKERLRHEQFADLRTHGEWFRYEGPLIEHVEMLRGASQ